MDKSASGQFSGTSRRDLLGLAGLMLFAAPAIVRSSSLMPINSPWLTIDEFMNRLGCRETINWFEEMTIGFRSDGVVSATPRSTGNEVQIGYGKLFPTQIKPGFQWPTKQMGDTLYGYRWRFGMRI